MDVALAKALEICKNPPASVALTKQGMWLALEMPSLRAGIEMENRQQVITAMTEDQPEATTAFLEKRDPDYKHRSEAHTSELQSLMRNPYAVFGWQKKRTN